MDFYYFLSDNKLEEQCTQKLSMLGGYLKFQLVNLSKVKNLRFHMVTHSESLKLHFKENFDGMINSSSVDWTQFNLDTVYTLLSNFCGITCPDRGWGYKPIDDISVGADIERIRFLVNEYLDDKTFKLEEADQILERWRWVKKEVDSRDIIDFDHETKINCK